MTETQGGVKRHHPEPLLHRTVRLAVSHTGRGDCSPHKITAKFKTTFCVPLSAVLAPRRTLQSVSPATHHSARAPLLRFLCEDGAFPALFLLFLRRPPSYPATGGHHRDRLARPSTPTCPEGSTASGGTAQRRTTGSSKRHHVSFTSPTTVACLLIPACQIQHHHHATKKSHRWGIALRLRGRYGVPILDYASSVCHDDSHCRLVADHGCQSGQIDSLLRTSELKAAVPELFAGHVVACSCCNRRVRGV